MSSIHCAGILAVALCSGVRDSAWDAIEDWIGRCNRLLSRNYHATVAVGLPADVVEDAAKMGRTVGTEYSLEVWSQGHRFHAICHDPAVPGLLEWGRDASYRWASLPGDQGDQLRTIVSRGTGSEPMAAPLDLFLRPAGMPLRSWLRRADNHEPGSASQGVTLSSSGSTLVLTFDRGTVPSRVAWQNADGVQYEAQVLEWSLCDARPDDRLPITIATSTRNRKADGNYRATMRIVYDDADRPWPRQPPTAAMTVSDLDLGINRVLSRPLKDVDEQCLGGLLRAVDDPATLAEERTVDYAPRRSLCGAYASFLFLERLGVNVELSELMREPMFQSLDGPRIEALHALVSRYCRVQLRDVPRRDDLDVGPVLALVLPGHFVMLDVDKNGETIMLDPPRILRGPDADKQLGKSWTGMIITPVRTSHRPRPRELVLGAVGGSFLSCGMVGLWRRRRRS